MFSIFQENCTNIDAKHSIRNWPFISIIVENQLKARNINNSNEYVSLQRHLDPICSIFVLNILSMHVSCGRDNGCTWIIETADVDVLNISDHMLLMQIDMNFQ